MASQQARDMLIQCLDLAAFGYIITVYSLDQTIFRTLLACLFHSEMVRPSAQRSLRVRRIGHRNVFVCAMINQIVAILSHIYSPEPRSQVDGYLHGSIITSFIGVLPPSRLHLVLTDCAVIVIELLVFCAACDPEYIQSPDPVDILSPTPLLADLHQGLSDDISILRVFKDNFIIPDPDSSSEASGESLEGSEGNQQPPISPQERPTPDSLAEYLRTMI